MMRDRIREFLESHDLKSFAITTVMLLSLIMVIYKCGGTDEIQSEKFEGRANALVISVTPKVHATQDRYGGRVNTDSYDIIYRYKVYGRKYEHLDNVKNIGRNEWLFQKITRTPLDSVQIMFQLDNPENSVIKR